MRRRQQETNKGTGLPKQDIVKPPKQKTNLRSVSGLANRGARDGVGRYRVAGAFHDGEAGTTPATPKKSFVRDNLVVAIAASAVNWLLHTVISFPDPNAEGVGNWLASIQRRAEPELWSGGIGFVVIYTAIVLLLVQGVIWDDFFSGVNGFGPALLANVLIGTLVFGPLIFFAPLAFVVIVTAIVALWFLALRLVGRPSKSTADSLTAPTLQQLLPTFGLTAMAVAAANTTVVLVSEPSGSGPKSEYMVAVLVVSVAQLGGQLFSIWLYSTSQKQGFVAGGILSLLFGVLLIIWYPVTFIFTIAGSLAMWCAAVRHNA